jgi:type IV secretory pathway VirB10-like protein
MTGVQSELDFNAPEVCLPEPHNAAEPATGASRGARRRLAVVAAGSVVIAGLTTLLLVHLHASPAPEAAVDTPERPSFPDGQTAGTQMFVAPKLSSVPTGDKTATAEHPAAVDPAPLLAMPLNSPNTRWQLPGSATASAAVALPVEPLKPDVLMVDLPSSGVEASQQDGLIHARRHDPHALTLSAGSIIGCALETAIDSSRGGYVTCVVTDDVVSDDARAVLIERGTHVLGEYRSDARLGDSRIGIIWNRLRKSDGTTVDLASAGTDQQGRSGISGIVDNHWFTRIGAAVLLSLIEDGITAASAPKANGTTLVFGNTAASGSTLSQKVLDASINLPPTITVNPGARISILVAKDIDFQSAYAER